MSEKLETLILHLVQTKEIDEQSTLQILLKEKGCDIPQATLSRRLKKLRIVKVDGIYKSLEAKPTTKLPILDIKISDSGLVVLHTYPGHANTLAYHIDQQNIEGVLGTVAGDDTVLIILQSSEIYSKFLDFLRSFFDVL